MANISTASLVPFYFKTKRTLAQSVTLSGFGIGTFLGPMLLTFLIDHYGFTGSYIILAGIALQGMVCGALYFPRGQPIEQQQLKQGSQHCKSDIETGQARNPMESIVDQIEMKEMNVESIQTIKADSQHKSIMSNGIASSSRNLRELKERTSMHHENRNDKTPISKDDCEVVSDLKTEFQKNINNLNKDERKYHANEDKHSLGVNVLRLKETEREATSSLEHRECKASWEVTTDVSSPTNNGTTLKTPVIVPYTCSGLFWLILFASVGLNCAAVTIGTFVPSLAQERGLDSEETLRVLFLIGLIEMLCSIPIGVLLDMQALKTYRGYIFCGLSMFIGLNIALFGIAHDKKSMMIFGSLLSISKESIYVQLPVLLAYLFGLENMQSIYGNTTGAMGLGGLIWQVIVGK